MATVATTTAEKTIADKTPAEKKPVTDEKTERKPQRARVDDRFKVFCGTANESLCDDVCNFLGLTRGQALVTRFKDGTFVWPGALFRLTPEELAAELDMTPEKVIEVQKYGREPISLHTPLGEDGDSEFGDLIEDSEAIQPGEAVSFTLLQEQLHSVLDTLSEREAGVVSMRFGLTDGQPKTLDEIGKVYGVTRERIRQIESKTMSKLRHPSRSQVLRDYLD